MQEQLFKTGISFIFLTWSGALEAGWIHSACGVAWFWEQF